MILNVICDLDPTVQFEANGDTWEDIVFHTKTHLTKEIVEAEISRRQAEYEATQYQRDRANEYPSIGDQLDALFHAGVFPPEMAAQIQAVKDMYPKEI